jgi:hypothetical protein
MSEPITDRRMRAIVIAQQELNAKLLGTVQKLEKNIRCFLWVKVDAGILVLYHNGLLIRSVVAPWIQIRLEIANYAPDGRPVSRKMQAFLTRLELPLNVCDFMFIIGTIIVRYSSKKCTVITGFDRCVHVISVTEMIRFIAGVYRDYDFRVSRPNR